VKKTEGKDEDLLRSEIRALSRDKGLRASDVALEVLRMIPEGFLLQYELLWLRGLKGGVSGPNGGDPDSAVEPARRVTRTSTSQVETRGAAKSGGRRQGVSGRTLLGDLRAVAYRARIDRKLRALGREMARWADDGGQVRMRRCTRCRVWTEEGWNYCPRDGAPTEEVDE
jgi:hypothetical protein